MTSRKRALLLGLFIVAVVAAAAGITWQTRRISRARTPRTPPPAVKSWKGGDLLACGITVDGASLQAFAREYNVVMMCGLGKSGDRSADRTITVSRAFSIEPRDFEIQEALSASMHVILADTAHRQHADSPAAQRLVEEDLWYELALLPKGADVFQIRTLADVERRGGRLLSTEPRWTVISTWQP